ncbi:hypothetical protein [Salinivibrio sp. HTSP]|uniref:hypothetical protein n=1 Tax=Salinivibrio sp. HTSP TaxID=2115977 RepID=UPI000E3141A3|nr:hypothetical protein [Salinivibrio sp. HTSP]
MKLSDIKEILSLDWTANKAIGAIFVLVASMLSVSLPVAIELPILAKLMILLVFYSAVHFVLAKVLLIMCRCILRVSKNCHRIFSSIKAVECLSDDEAIILNKCIEENGVYRNHHEIKKIISKGVGVKKHDVNSKVLLLNWLVTAFVKLKFKKLKNKQKSVLVQNFNGNIAKYLAVFFNRDVESLMNQHGLVPYEVTEYYEDLSRYGLITITKNKSSSVYALDTNLSKQLSAKYFEAVKDVGPIELKDAEVQAHIYTTGGGLASGNRT